jgi:hypothetical protein
MTLADAAAAAKAAGFTGIHLVEAVAVASAESDGVNDQVTHDGNGTFDTGLWQINSVHSEYNAQQLKDPNYNAKAAYTLSKGGTDWSAWTTFHNKRAQSRVGLAEQTLSSTGIDTTATTAYATQPVFLGIPGTPSIPNPFSGIPNPLDALGAVNSVFSHLLSGSFWARIGEGFAALILIGIGLSLVFRKETEAVVKTAGKAAANLGTKAAMA